MDIPAHPVALPAYLLAGLVASHDGHVQVENDGLIGGAPRLVHCHEPVLRLVRQENTQRVKGVKDHPQLEAVVVRYQDTVKFPGLVLDCYVVYLNRVERTRVLPTNVWRWCSRIPLHRSEPIYGRHDMLAEPLETTS